MKYIEELISYQEDIDVMQISEILWLSQFIGNNDSVTINTFDNSFNESDEREGNLEKTTDTEVKDENEVPWYKASTSQTTNRDYGFDENNDTSSSFSTTIKHKENFPKIDNQFSHLKIKQKILNSNLLDELKTADYIATTGYFNPIFKEEKSKKSYFNLHIIIDQSESIFLWEKYVKHFIKEVKFSTNFKSVKVFHLISNKDNISLNYVNSNYNINPNSALFKDRESLTLIFSDIVGKTWKTNEMFKLLEKWSKGSFVTIVSMLPQRMWRKTPLRRGVSILTKSTKYLPKNKDLKAEFNFMSKKESLQNINIPLLTFDSHSFAYLSNVLISKKDSWIDTRIFQNIIINKNINDRKIVDISAKKRVEKFFSFALPKVRELAIYCSVLPLNQEIIREVIRVKELGDEKDIFSEFYFGGLLDIKSQADIGDYKFYDDVAKVLREYISLEDAKILFTVVSDVISNILGVKYDLKLLYEANIDEPLSDKEKLLANMMIEILKDKGSFYTDKIKVLENKLNTASVFESKNELKDNIFMNNQKLSEVLNQLNIKFKELNISESDTHIEIMNTIMNNIFYWSDLNLKKDLDMNEDYIDYELVYKEKTHLVIEVNKEKIRFNFSEYQELYHHRIKVKLLMKDLSTSKTIVQVKNYCNDIGCSYACISNGYEWAFFRTYIEGKNWRDGDAYIISSLEDFIDNFNEIEEYFNFDKIVNHSSLKKLFDNEIKYSLAQQRYEPKLHIDGYKEQIANNHIERQVRGYFDKYFGEIRSNDKELLEKCYVTERDYNMNFNKVTNILEDALSPYLLDKEKFPNIEIDKSEEKNIFSNESEEQNTFSDEIAKIIVEEKKSKVLVLFGGKGAGKTTFLVSLFTSEKNKSISENSVIGQVNLLKVANDKEAIKQEIMSQLILKLDIDKLLNGSNSDLTLLFKDKFEIELRQSLEGLNPQSEIFILKRNELLKEYKQDKLYCLERLANYLRGKKKAIIINIDNTDQFDQDLQNYCFSLANELSQKLYCISIISLREERYISSNIEGYLDAYEKNGFHISSPNPQQVFLKRLTFIAEKINSEKKITSKNKKDIMKLFDILKNNLLKKDSEFNKFMMAATHGNIRQGLELFKNFIFSNYTNVEEMIRQGTWYITLHQILKPMMIPTYRYFNENTSTSIPNIFRLRSDYNSSHFTAYRILQKLAINNDAYVPITELQSYFIETFNMEDDFILNLDLLLKRGMVESENGLDKYSEELEQVKISSFGYYMQEIIFKDFTYLELISSDLAVFDKRVSDGIIRYSNEDYKLLKKGQNISSKQKGYDVRYKRINTRIAKVDVFCSYLEEEEKREINSYNLNKDFMISKNISKSFNEQKGFILRSARKNLNINQNTKEENRHGIRKLDR